MHTLSALLHLIFAKTQWLMIKNDIVIYMYNFINQLLVCQRFFVIHHEQYTSGTRNILTITYRIESYREGQIEHIYG